MKHKRNLSNSNVFGFVSFLVLFLVSPYLQAKNNWDYNANLGVRSFPKSTALYGDFGRGFLLWENKKTNYTYGYIRPAVNWSTSLLYNDLHAQLEVYPISNFGIFAGKGISIRKTDLDGFACDSVQCQGKFDVTFIGSILGAKWRDYFFLFNGRYDIFKVKENIDPFADAESGLIGNQGRDSLTKLQFIVGKELTEKIGIGAYLTDFKMNGSNQRSDFLMGFVSYQFGQFSSVLAFGNYHSERLGNNLTGSLLLTWNPEQGLKLF